MPHIKLSKEFAGIVSLFDFSPETSKPLNQLAEILLNGPSTLSKWERELIATYVSFLNECNFCCNTHGAMVEELNKDDQNIVDTVKKDVDTAPVSEKMKALLKIAGKVQKEARKVLPTDIEKAKSEGASDKEIHDTVLIAAAFCMYNKYVDGLATTEWDDGKETYQERARLTVEGGYFHQDFD